jgi:glycosyltransferase 2 family protein
MEWMQIDRTLLLPSFDPIAMFVVDYQRRLARTGYNSNVMEPQPSPKLSVRNVLVWIALVMALAFIAVSITELQNIANALSRGNWLFLVLAFALQVLVLVNNAETYRSLFKLVGVEESWKHLFFLSTAFTFVNLIAPSGGIGGVAVFMDSAKQRGQSPAKSMVVGILYAIYEYITLLMVVFLGFVTLIRRNQFSGGMSGGEITAAILLLVATIGFGLLLYLGYRSSERLGNLLARFASLVNRMLFRFTKKEVWNPENARTLAMEVGEGVSAIEQSKGRLLRPFLFALANKILLILLLTSIFIAFNVDFSLGSVVAGYGFCQLFFYVSPTPAGIGVVESLFPVILNLLRVPLASGLLITLLYRGITVWLTFGIGFWSFRKLQREYAKEQRTLTAE